MNTDMKGRRVIIHVNRRWVGGILNGDWTVDRKELTIMDHILVPQSESGLISSAITGITNYLCMEKDGKACQIKPSDIVEILPENN